MAGFYSTSAWVRIRARQLAREPLCQACADIEPATEVDHVIPITKGGAKRDASNLQSLCHACHSAKTRAEQAGIQWIAPKYRGCDINGAPRNQTGWGDRSTGPSDLGAPPSSKPELINPKVC